MRALAAAGLAVVALAAPGSASAAVGLQQVGDFESPVHVTGAPGDDERLYVVEQAGIIKVVRNGIPSVFADLTDPVAYPGGEDGLLSMAFAPDFKTSRLLYVFFTNTDADPNAGDGPDLEIAELRAPTGDAVDPLSLRTVLQIPHDENNNHNGGQLQFGPDGYLYVSTGDGGGSYDQPVDDAVRTDSLLGKILRIDPRGAAAGDYTVPPDNPFGNEVWSYGLRNPWRFSFDRSTGDLVIGDVGQDTVEEVNFAPATAGGGSGANFGWDECEGNLDAKPPPPGGAPLPPGADPCPLPDDVPPLLSLMQSGGFCSVIGGYVVRDPTLPTLLGRYVYSDLCRGRLRSVNLAAGASDDGDVSPNVDLFQPTSFGEDAAACIYVASWSGPVYRLVDQDTRVPCELAPAGGGGVRLPDGAGPSTDELLDLTAPAMAARVRRRQRVLHNGGAIAYVRCDELCAIAAGGWLRIAGGRRIFRMRRTVQGSQVTRRHRVKVRLTRRGRRALRSALAEGRRARVRVGLRARDAAGNRSALQRFTVRVRR